MYKMDDEGAWPADKEGFDEGSFGNAKERV